MTESQQEQLVLLEVAGVGPAIAEIEALAPVTQTLPPRLLLVHADADARNAILRIPGVVSVFDVAAAPIDVPLDLSQAERVFVAAWLTRSAPKTRRGDGLDWDAPGFEPPDAH
ncbi:MAG TPA: hypothetical protein VJ777_03940 [Mycobacterium sp.]|nr:hypothetical protein [Mycobacterium sp.]